MTHNEAITLIRDGGLYVRLTLRKTHAPPPSLDGKGVDGFDRGSLLLLCFSEVKSAMGTVAESTNIYWKASPYT